VTRVARAAGRGARGLALSGLLVAALTATASAQALVAPALRAEAARLLHDLAALRGVSSPGAVPPIVVRTREERRRYVAGEFARKYSPARIEAERRAMVAWGLVPGDFDLAGFLADLLAEQAAAYYDPVAKRMILANWLTPELRSHALGHELVHALQDRIVSLDAFLAAAPGRSDLALARQALVEGEAVALQFELTLRRAGQELAGVPDVQELQRAIRTSTTGPVVGRAPRFVRAMLTFPYAAGVGFVHAFRQRRPWAALSAVYDDPPRSSAQILHPERYLDRREDPVALTLPDLAAVLPTGARRVVEDDLGEFGLGEVLARFLDDAAPAVPWRGDRYALWEIPGAPPLLVALTAWESEAAAARFATAYARVLALKHGVGAAAADAALTAWAAGPRGLAVERRGARVLLLDGAPVARLDAVRRAAWARVLY
jgi:hypothetical protein